MIGKSKVPSLVYVKAQDTGAQSQLSVDSHVLHMCADLAVTGHSRIELLSTSSMRPEELYERKCLKHLYPDQD
jgi:hypothetical protein